MKTYVNKNQYGYDTMGIIVDDDNKKVYYYGTSRMPIGKHKKTSKKAIREMIDMYRSCGYQVVLEVWDAKLLLDRNYILTDNHSVHDKNVYADNARRSQFYNTLDYFFRVKLLMMTSTDI